MKFKMTLLGISVFSSLLLSLLLHPSWNIDTWIDSVFLVGLFLLVISAIMLVIEGAFFVAFIKSFNYFYVRVSKKEQLIRESDKCSNQTVTFQKNFPSKTFYFKVGVLFCTISLIASLSMIHFGR